MGALRFDGVDDFVRWSEVQSELADVTQVGSVTCAFLFRRAGLGTDQELGVLSTSAGGARFGCGFNTDNSLDPDPLGLPSLTITVADVTDTYILVMSKASTEDPIVWSLKNLTTDAPWQHEVTDSFSGIPATAGRVEVGHFSGFEFLDAWVGLAAFWAGGLSQADAEALAVNRRTSDWWTNPHGQPAFLAEFNIEDVTQLRDLAENASNISVAGATYDDAVTLEDWNFDGKGPVTDPDLEGEDRQAFPKRKLADEERGLTEEE